MSPEELDALRFAHTKVVCNDKVVIYIGNKKTAATALSSSVRKNDNGTWWLDVKDCNNKKHLCRWIPTSHTGGKWLSFNKS